MTVEQIRVSPAWLELREPADAAARARGLVRRLPAAREWVIHDLACGTGSMGRWLAPLLGGRQHWVLHDRDSELLELAAAHVPTGVSAETRCSDITQLSADDLAGATLITASALLDLLTADELEGLTDVCIETGCPVLLTLTVLGRAQLEPAYALDSRVAAAFDAHQRRVTAAGRLLGPDAVTAAVVGFRRRGAEVIVAPSPWRLRAQQASLAAEWFEGWLGAACEIDADLADDAEGYARARRAQLRAGDLQVTVDHADVLVLP